MFGPRGRNGGRGRGRSRGQSRGTHQNGSHGLSSSAQSSSRFSKPVPPSEGEMNADLPERFGRGKSNQYRSAHNRLSSTNQDGIDVSLNTDIRKYMQDQASLASSSDKDRWIDALEIPKSGEITLSVGTMVDLVPNKADEKFRSVQRYLKTHYSLLREDAVGPLRDAVDKFRKTPDMEDDNELSIYEKVHISRFTFTNMGIAARLKFSTRRAGRKIMWTASKRLVSGSLVALTPADDKFQDKCIVAIIAARPLDLLELSPPEVDMYFSCPEDIHIDPQIEYIMLESKTGYYEAYRHTLKALQKISEESFPLSPQLIGSDTDIGPPQYLANWPNRSLAAALNNSDHNSDHNSSAAYSSVDTINDWPDTPKETSLDDSQWDALKQILTKKLAIVQGPPGTGKTHVSKVALQIMMQNRAEGEPPIIVAAQTNHALDQLLKHVSEFDPNFIRLGGRSTIANIKKRALFEVRQRERIPHIPGSLFGPARKKLEREQAKYGDLLSIFDENAETISCDKLCELKIITAEQRQSLINAANNWVTADVEHRSPMQYWLHRALVPFEVAYDDDTFGFDDLEEDLEIEQLRETEAEHGVADEEDIEMLKGPWYNVVDRWTVVTPSENDIEVAKRMLDTKQDLWDVPEYLRGPVYFVMKQKAKDMTLFKFRNEAKAYQEIVSELKVGKWEKDAVFLKRANIVGMTTTGLSKYRPLIASLRPKIILIEEAAEVLEGPITVACMESVEHLILVGDHQQLQGRCALQELEGEPFLLNVSMFERLVNLGLPYKTLQSQRRMIPEIRELVSSLYPRLEDHASVLTRRAPPAWGTGSVRSFFFHHDWSELKDETLSTYNEEEARMVAKFYRHLLRNGVPPAAITILTFYNGQRKRILKELRNDPETNSTYNNVKTVDSYQGEENEIIILSLVRSNTQGQIGFLNIDNRVCVALSRARNGFYLFGNGYLMSEKSELWSNVGKLMSESQPTRFDDKLPLTCRNHNRTVTVQWPEDFDRNDGGCDFWCGTDLPCGHSCSRRCHPAPHQLLQCTEQCKKALSCGHQCAKKCHELCYCDCDNYFPERVVVGRSAVGDHHQLNHDSCRSPSPVLSDLNTSTISGRSSPDEFGVGGYARSTMGPYQSGRALARGGAAFQPILTPPGIGPQEPRSSGNADVAPGTSSEQGPNWTSFANGGVKEDDQSREEQRTPKRSNEAGDLLDLSPPEHGPGSVEHSVEQKVEGDRTRSTQTYRPAALSGFGTPRTTRSISQPLKEGPKHVQNRKD